MSDQRDSTNAAARGRWLYPLLFGVQTIGAAIFVWNGVPHYREILSDPATHEAEAWTLVWSLSAIAFMQVGYWIRYRMRPPLPQFKSSLLGHVIQFTSRMGFVLATSVFGFVFITQKPGFNMPAFRYVLTVASLFALFCYTQEFTRLGSAFMSQEKKPDAPADRK